MKLRVFALLLLAPLAASAEVGDSSLAAICLSGLVDAAATGHVSDALDRLQRAVQDEQRSRVERRPRRAEGLSTVVRPGGSLPLVLVAESELAGLSDTDLELLDRRLTEVSRRHHSHVNPNRPDALAVGPYRVPARHVHDMFAGQAPDELWDDATESVRECERSARWAWRKALAVPGACFLATVGLAVMKLTGVWVVHPTWVTGLQATGYLSGMVLVGQALERRDELHASVNARGDLGGERSLAGLERSPSPGGPFTQPSDGESLRRFGAKILAESQIVSREPRVFYFAAADRNATRARDELDFWVSTVPGRPDWVDVSLLVRPVR